MSFFPSIHFSSLGDLGACLQWFFSSLFFFVPMARPYCAEKRDKTQNKLTITGQRRTPSPTSNQRKLSSRRNRGAAHNPQKTQSSKSTNCKQAPLQEEDTHEWEEKLRKPATIWIHSHSVSGCIVKPWAHLVFLCNVDKLAQAVSNKHYTCFPNCWEKLSLHRVSSTHQYSQISNTVKNISSRSFKNSKYDTWILSDNLRDYLF